MIPTPERRAFEAFVAESSDRLVRTAYLLCGDRGHAEDLVQTALLRTARRWRAARQAPHAYARAVVINLAKDRWRALDRRPAEVALVPAVDLPAASDATSDLLDRHDLIAAFGQLAEGQRTVLVLRFFEDLSVEDTAAAMKCTTGTVKSQTSRALAALRSLLDTSPTSTRETSNAH
jgi:RNA polymerase sigma-70 factor (sigma-E family)